MSVILGTAGHIDHGKTALVRALTGVDTDRLKEEKARGITIELGFTELDTEQGLHFGVVDVPGHEAFVRTMVAGAAGMQVVLLVVAADEGVMPQTREHLAIIELLAVPELVVALTKCDAVEDEWLELVEADVREVLEGTSYGTARMVRTSATAGTGLETLLDALVDAGRKVRETARDDLVRLPLDRVFTIQGTGTVVTGTLWSGSLRAGERVRILPDDLEARVRSVQVHGREVESAVGGDRVAVALTGAGSDREVVSRGATLVTDPAWSPTWMLTGRVRMLGDTAWTLAHNQRVHVHLGTAEVLARCALLEPRDLEAGDVGWLQLRLEQPLVARARDRFVIRAYSPVTTIGGGEVAEARPPKRTALDARSRAALQAVLDGEGEAALSAQLDLAGWSGSGRSELPVLLGMTADGVERALSALAGERRLTTAKRVFGAGVRAEATRLVLSEVDAGHAEDPLRTSIPLARVRSALPTWAPSDLADAIVESLVAEGVLEAVEGGVRRPGHEVSLTSEQAAASAKLEVLLESEGLAAPSVEELPDELRARPDLWSLLRRLEELDVLCQVADGLYLSRKEIEAAEQRVRSTLAGRANLGPADFREAIPVTRKRLIPLLNYFDGRGTTIRSGEGRAVPSGD